MVIYRVALLLGIFVLLISTANALYVSDKMMCKDKPGDGSCTQSNGYYDAQDEIWFFYRTYNLGNGGSYCQTPSMYTPGNYWWDSYSSSCWSLSSYYWYYWWWSHWYGSDNGYTWYPGSYTAKYKWTYPGYSSSFEYYFTIRGLTVNAISTCSSRAQDDSCASNGGHYRTTDVVHLFFRTWWVNHRDNCYNVDVATTIDGPNGIHWTYGTKNYNGCDGRWDYRWWWQDWGVPGNAWIPGTYTAHYTITDKKVYSFSRSFDVSWTVDTPDCSVYNGCSNNVMKKNCRYDTYSAQCVCDTYTMPQDGYYCGDSNTKEYRDYTGCSGTNWIYSASNSYDCNSMNAAGTSYSCRADSIYRKDYSYDYDCSNGNNQVPGATCQLSAGSTDKEIFVENCNSRDGQYCSEDSSSKMYRDYTCTLTYSNPNPIFIIMATRGTGPATGATCNYVPTSVQRCTFGCGYLNSAPICKNVTLTSAKVESGNDSSIVVKTDYTSYGINGKVNFIVDVIKGTSPGCYKLWCGDPSAESECGSCADGQKYVVDVTASTAGSIDIPVNLPSGESGTYNVRVTATNLSGTPYSSIWALENITLNFVTQVLGFIPTGGNDNTDGSGTGIDGLAVGAIIAATGAIVGAIYIGTTRLRGTSLSGSVNSLTSSLEKSQKIVANIINDFSQNYSDTIDDTPPIYSNTSKPPPDDDTYSVPQPQGDYSGTVELPPIYKKNYNVNYGSPAVIPPYSQLPGYREPGWSPDTPRDSNFYEELRNWLLYYYYEGFDMNYTVNWLANKYNLTTDVLWALLGGATPNTPSVPPDGDSSDYYYGITYPASFWLGNPEETGGSEKDIREMGFSGVSDAVQWLKDALEGPLGFLGSIPIIGGFFQFQTDILIGFLDGLAQTIDGILTFFNMMIHDPFGTISVMASAIWEAVTHPVETLNGIVNYFKEEVDQGHPGRAVGKALFEIVSFVVAPAKIAEAVGLGSKLTKFMELIRIGDVTSDAVRASAKFAARLGEDSAELAKAFAKIDATLARRIAALAEVKGSEEWVKTIRAAIKNNGHVPDSQLRGIIGEVEKVEALRASGFKVLQVSQKNVHVIIPNKYLSKFKPTQFVRNGNEVIMEIDAIAEKNGMRYFVEKKNWATLRQNLDSIKNLDILKDLERQIIKYKYLAKANNGKAIFDINPKLFDNLEGLSLDELNKVNDIKSILDAEYILKNGQWVSR